MSSTSGENCPGSTSDESTSPRTITNRGDVIDTTVEERPSDGVLDRLHSNVSVSEPVQAESGLSQPRREPYPVIGPEDIQRARLSWAILGLLSTFVVLGLAAVVFAEVTGHPTTSIIEYVKLSYSYLIPLVTLVLGYYYGRHRRRVSP